MKKHELTDEQEQLRIEGLRTLARIIARHHLAHPDLYPSASAEEQAAPSRNSERDGEEEGARRDDVA